MPDVYLLGKALGGGIVPVSAVVADADVLGVLRPGTHGSTFGGNPLACAVGRAVVAMLATGEFQERATPARRAAARRGSTPWSATASSPSGCAACGPGSTSTRALGTGREVCEALARRHVLAKDTHGSTIRLAPPIVITEEQLDAGLDALEDVLRELAPDSTPRLTPGTVGRFATPTW